jgi:hypothetical protein
MNKRLPILPLLLLMLLLAACGSESAWDSEPVVAANPRILSDDVKVAWSITDGQAPGSGDSRNKNIRLTITKKDGSSINDFDITHEKLLHLIIVSQDLSWFSHIHPEYKGGGVFEIASEIPAGGSYRFIADFKPTGGDAMSKLEWLQVSGERAVPALITPDNLRDKVVDGTRIALTIDKPEARKELTLSFTLTDETTGEPVTDIEPYLGAIGHVVILRQDGEKYLHVHAEDGQGSGPVASFETEFPQPGVYKIWGQFQRHGQVLTASYVIDIP